MHSNGIAHRDLKVRFTFNKMTFSFFLKIKKKQPENLMLTSTNHLKMIDFGTAYFFNTNFVNKELLKTINQIKSLEKGEAAEDLVEDY